MDLHKACNILNIEVNDILDKKKLKKAYHREALRYHPDKIHIQTNNNKNCDPGQRFREIKEAYEFLNMYTGCVYKLVSKTSPGPFWNIP